MMSFDRSQPAQLTLRPLRLDADISSLLSLLRVLYPSIEESLLLSRIRAIQHQGWSCNLALERIASHDVVVGLAGYWVQTRICYGRYLYVDHFIVSDHARSRGVGAAMWDALETSARSAECERIVLDTFIANSVAQRFWMNRGCHIVGFHFGKHLSRGVI